MWTRALLFAAAVACPPDEAAWRERLSLPRLFQVRLDLGVRTEDLDLDGFRLEFPADPVERLAEAQRELAAGVRDPRLLHQVVSALVSMKRTDKLDEVVPACLSAYGKEVAARPEDVELSLAYAQAFALAGDISRDGRFYRDGVAALDAVREHAAEDRSVDWRVADLRAELLVRRALVSPAGPEAGAWLAEAIASAERAVADAPREARPHWTRFQARYWALTRSEEGLSVPRVAALARELAEGTAELARGADLALVAEGYGFLASLPAFLDGTSTPEDAAGVQQRLAAFRSRLDGAELGPLVAKVARPWWTLDVLAGPVDTWEEDLARVVATGVPRAEALGLAIVGFERRGALDAARAADALARALPDEGGEPARRARTILLHGAGEDAAALEVANALPEADPAVRLARAVLALRLGRDEGIAGSLSILAAQTARSPLAGEVDHALGVALALEGRDEEAIAALERAVERLADSAPARLTLEELRARR